MRRRRPGFTLVELLAVLAIGAALLAVALPDLNALLRAQQLRGATSDLIEAIGLARAQAIARNERIRLAPRDPAGSDWAQGWTVFADRDEDGAAGPGDEIIAVHGPLASGFAFDFGFAGPAPPYYIAYNGAGRSCSDTSSAAARPGTLTLFYGGAIRRIKINMLGRARACDPARDDNCEGAEAPS
ncbi:GspH/FimT family pseudopilin [Massilia sp. GCM10023247]|uniref:GspH/FimT family pseudopilin n=1 Tax=Massilia sp. GCM10023247 TaxID=3252643 RepID=UPI00361EDF06